MGSCYSSSSSSSSSSYSFSSSTEKSSSSESDDGNARVEQPTTTAATSATSTTASHLWKKKKKKKKIMKMLMKNQKKKNKKKSSRENNKSSSGGLGLGIDESVLRNMQGRMSSNGATKTASLYTQQGKKGTNQDAMLVWEKFNSRSDTVLCGVFDGHGPFGHTVAKRVRDTLPLILCSQWKAASASSNAIAGQIQSSPPPHTCTTTEKSPAGSPSSEETASPTMDDYAADHHSLDAEDNKILPEMCIPLKKSILEAFNLMDKELKLHPTIDCFCSGTTAVTLIKRGQDVVIANVGDSRAVLGTRDKDNSLVAIQLTVDLKPDLPREAARIQQCKGRVFALQDEPEVARVWLPNNDSPGLAMARAFGDFCLKDFGLISVPDIYYHQLSERDQFVILASDGIWDVLSNKEAVDIVASAPGHAMAARALVDCAIRAWRLKYPTSKTDDCAVVCLFFEHLHAENGAVEEENEQIPYKSINRVVETRETASQLETDDNGFILKHSGTVRGCDEIVPVSDLTEENLSVKSQGHSKRSLAECISAAEDEEWSALEGITRVNSLLSIPRLFSSDKRTTSWRKWL